MESRGFTAQQEAQLASLDTPAKVQQFLDSIRHFPLLSADMEATLNPVDRRSMDAGLLGVNEAGLYRPSHDTG